jgi:RNA polymerase sigma factor FliA
MNYLRASVDRLKILDDGNVRLEPAKCAPTNIAATLASSEATDAALLRAETVRRLTEAVEQLPERLRTVLSLHYIEDLTYREIAGMLDVSEPRVCQLHGEALVQLHKLLAET